jgi:hypothetical protein
MAIAVSGRRALRGYKALYEVERGCRGPHRLASPTSKTPIVPPRAQASGSGEGNINQGSQDQPRNFVLGDSKKAHDTDSLGTSIEI